MKNYKGIILIVDDGEDLLDALRAAFTLHGFFVYSYINGKSAIYAIKNQGINYDLALIDLEMPGIGGDVVIDCSKKINPKIPVFCITAYDYRPANADELIQKDTLAENILRIEKICMKQAQKIKSEIKGEKNGTKTT